MIKKKCKRMVTFKGAGKGTEWTLFFYKKGVSRLGFDL